MFKINKFEKLKAQLYVMRCIAFHRPHAHLAFLYHKPYRAMYDNEGQNIELCEEHYGQWIYVAEEKPSWFEKVYLLMKHNDNLVYHPRCALIAMDFEEGDVLVLKRTRIYTKDDGPSYEEYFKSAVLFSFIVEEYPVEIVRFHEAKDVETFTHMLQYYRTKAVTTWKGWKMY